MEIPETTIIVKVGRDLSGESTGWFRQFIPFRLCRGAEPSGVTARCYPGGPFREFLCLLNGTPSLFPDYRLRQHAYEFIPIFTVHAE